MGSRWGEPRQGRWWAGGGPGRGPGSPGKSPGGGPGRAPRAQTSPNLKTASDHPFPITTNHTTAGIFCIDIRHGGSLTTQGGKREDELFVRVGSQDHEIVIS